MRDSYRKQADRRTYPVSFEAILGAEVAILEAKLEACWALQSTGVLLTICAHALSFGGRFVSHVGRQP